MADCPPDSIHRAPGGEVWIDHDTCIGCGNCAGNCPYGVIQMAATPPRKPGLLQWLLFGRGPGPGQDKTAKAKAEKKGGPEPVKLAVKCDMCMGIKGGPACVRACPTGAAIRTSPEVFLNTVVTR
jgi:Fe-S-cluster-containing hydrogenase component 2